MTQEKILEYLKAEFENNKRLMPARSDYSYSDDYKYDLDTTAWDTEYCVLKRIIDNIERYDNEEDTKRYVDNFIKLVEE